MNTDTVESRRVPARAPHLSSRFVRQPVARRMRLLPLVGLLLAAGCGDVDDPVSGTASALRNNGRSPEQKKCDEKWQNCYVDCSVRYPESSDPLDEDRRQGCFDSCDASHNLCAPARAAAGGAALSGSVVDAAEVAPASPVTSTVSIDAVNAAALRTAAATKSCTLSSDGGMWCCVPISTPPYLKCTYTPPPDTIWTLTAQAARAP